MIDHRTARERKTARERHHARRQWRQEHRILRRALERAYMEATLKRVRP